MKHTLIIVALILSASCSPEPKSTPAPTITPTATNLPLYPTDKPSATSAPTDAPTARPSRTPRPTTAPTWTLSIAESTRAAAKLSPTPKPTAASVVIASTPEPKSTPAAIAETATPGAVDTPTAEAATSAPSPIGGGYVCAGGAACIKGNINSSGDKIYHFPGCGSYNATKIDEGAGERYFSTAADAEAAGWRKAGNCP